MRISDWSSDVCSSDLEPGSVTFGVTTPGSLARQVMEKFKSLVGIEAPVVTHARGGELLISVLNGTVELGIGEVKELSAQHEPKDGRMITHPTKQPMDQIPERPTAQAQGHNTERNN